MRSQAVKRPVYRLVLVTLLVLCTFARETAVWAQTSIPAESEQSFAYAREVRDIEVGKKGIPNPTGITYLPGANLFLVLEQSGLTDEDGNAVELFFVNSDEEVVGSVTLETSISNLNNVTYDSVAKRVLILDAARNELVEVKLGEDGLPDPSTMTRVNVQQFGVRSPRGIAIDASGALLILDPVGPSIVKVVPAADGSFEGASAQSDGRISEIDLQIPGLNDAQGLAYDPAAGNLHTLSPNQNKIFEVAASGEVVAVRDIGDFYIHTPQAMVFAPTGDRTDAPELVSLYIVHRTGTLLPAAGPQVEPQQRDYTFFLPLLSGGTQVKAAKTEGGLIKELSFNEPPAFAQTADVTTATLVRTINAFNFDPPSGDTAGVTLIENTGQIIFNDSEIEEMPIHYDGANLWKITTANPSTVVDTYTTAFEGVPPGFSDEPTGVAYNQGNGHLYVVSDDDNGIHQIDPGPDGRYGTLDDIRTFVNTNDYGITDPEDVAYSNSPPTFYIADGEHAEVYVVTSGNNGLFDGLPPAGDDVSTHFDTSVHTITDMEGIGYDPVANTLYLAGGNKTAIAEVSVTGTLIRMIDTSAAGARTPAGVVRAPSSTNPAVMSIYIADRGIDNDTNPQVPLDGKIYEMAVDSVTPGNQPPAVTATGSPTIELGASALLTGTVTDDGIPPFPGVTSLWTKFSGPGNVTFANNAAPSTTASFTLPGNYVLRLAAHDGELGTFVHVPVFVTPSDGTNLVEKRVAVGSDDAEEVRAGGVVGTVLTTHTDLALGNDGSVPNLREMLVGIRFPDLTVPRGATITNAYIQFMVDENDNTTPHTVLVEGQASDNPLTFEATPTNISTRPRTTAEVSWAIPSWPTVGAATAAQRTPNLTAIVQELIDRPGWANGNAMAFLISYVNGVRRIAEAFEGTPAGAPLLHIEYQLLNEAPVVNAGADQAVVFPTATLTGTLTDDGLPAPATTVWTKVSGPGTVTFSNAAALNTTATFSVGGTYVLQLGANDGELAGNDTVTIAVNQAPTVDAGLDKQVNMPGGANQLLDGTVTDDGLLSAFTVEWSQDSGPALVTFATPSSVDTGITIPMQGIYVLRLTVNDGQHSASDVMQISASTVNQTPTVNAGPDKSVTLPASVIVTGTIIDDGAPVAASTTWSKVSGPGDVTFGNAAALSTQVSFSIDGAYVLRLTATDTQLTSSDDVAITVAPVANTPPVVNAGPDQTIDLPEGATLNGTITDDGLPSNTVTTQWTKLSGPGVVNFANATAEDTTATFSEAGDYVLNLTASDGEFSESDSIAIKVQDDNEAPVVNAGSDQSVVFPADAILNGTVTDDGVPVAATTTWSKLSGPGIVTFANANLVDTTASFSGVGDYVLRLTATDGVFTASDDVAITVTEENVPVENQPPVVTAGADQGVTLPDSATLDGTLTDDGLPAAATTTWSKVSGPGDVTFANASTVDTTASFSVAGTYVLRLTADDGEFTDSDDVSITVQGATDPTSQVPIINSGDNQTITLPGVATLNGLATDDNLPDPLTTLWSKVSGPGTVTFANANAANTTATFSVAGTYVLRLTVNDGEHTVTDDITIVVNGADERHTLSLPNISTD